VSGGRVGDLAAVGNFASILGTFAGEGQRQLTECNQAIETIEDRHQNVSDRRRAVIRETQGEIDSLESELRSCLRQEDADCSGIEGALTAAKRRLDEHQQLQERLAAMYRSFEQEVGEFRSASSAFAGSLVDGEAESANLQRRLTELSTY
jgi:chromosome segregation ATPase